ncbi:hypothetical protein FBY35_6692 [Streptomyces sp. SLBN-118]|uniref:hypothetical protein n=1 Tax=Streptomyces sp. SLBN-118 TaxID=2768454 RepID=UPI00114DA1AA|nr:hypothetical protein [Streptomyces sp. SLBN-118]TQK45148.1 hypothetical protein FBY35_6692 [Streptomyces sp. SLBN-118]
MSAAVVRRARRWFWGLAVTAVCAAGALYEALRGAPGPGTAMLVLISALVLAASAFQAARILNVLAGPPRNPLRPRPQAAAVAGQLRDSANDNRVARTGSRPTATPTD